MTDAMAPMQVPQNYHETLPSGLRALTLVQHHSLRCVVVNEDNIIIFDRTLPAETRRDLVQWVFDTIWRLK